MSAATTVRHVLWTITTDPLAVPPGKSSSPNDYQLLNTMLTETNRRVVCTGAAPTGSPSNPTQAVSYVDNSYFSFPYALTNFDNSASCASAASACSENYEICTKQLGGNGDYAVTIEVPGGGGVTVDGSNQDLGPSATSICSSLSSEACSAVEATQCDSYDDPASSLYPSRGMLLASVALSSIAVKLLG